MTVAHPASGLGDKVSYVTNRTKAVVYVRISQDRTGEEAGVTRQRQDCERLAKQRGWKDAEVLTDNDISAKGDRVRPGFERLLSMINNRQVSVVVAWTWERLERNRREGLRLIEAGQEAGLTISLVRGSDIDMATPAGRLVADMLSAMARNEIEVKSDRQKRANDQHVENGERVGGRRPFGYEWNRRRLKPHPEEAQAVRDAFSWVLDGVPNAQIARRWNERGFSSPQGNPWQGATVSKALRKPVYAGIVTRPLRGKGKTTRAAIRNAERVDVEATWEALVSVEDWHAVQAILNDPSRVPPKGHQKLLSGVAICGKCREYTMHAGGGKTGLGVYSCSGPVAHLTRKRQPIDDWVEAVAVAYLGDRRNRSVWDVPKGDHADIGELLKTASTIRSQLDGLARLFTQGILTEAGVRSESERLREELADVEAAMASAEDERLADARAVADADDTEAAWKALPIHTRRDIIAVLFDVVIHSPGRGTRSFNPDTVEVTPKVVQ